MGWNMLKNQDELLGYSVESGATQRIQDDSWKFLEGKTISFSSFPPPLNSSHSSLVHWLDRKSAVVGEGTATLTYKMNEVMQIDFNIKINTSGSGTGTYGISTALLRTLSVDIPSLTPLDGGVLNIYNSSGASTMTYGSSFLASGAYWKPAYISSGALAQINEAFFTSGMRISGTCYGKYVFED